MRRLLLVVLLSSGCDTLFPEFFPPGPDASSTGDGGTAPSAAHIAGQVCALTDVRDFRSCGPVRSGSFHVSIEETRDQAQADSSGVFYLATSAPLASGTLGVVDATGQYSPTVTVVHPIGGVLDQFALPVLAVSEQEEMAEVNGFALDPARGALLAWAIDETGTPVAGVRSTATVQAAGPFYDGAAIDSIGPGTATQAHGLVAEFDLPPGNLALTLSVPAGAAVTGDTFTLPIRAGAVTLVALTLPPSSP
jgi:hypothetical protein